MKIVKVIHGYPMLYNAGSEVASQMLCQELANRHEVHVFTREENSFAPDGSIRITTDESDQRVQLHIVNNPRHKDRHCEELIDRQFAQLLETVKPDIVHIGHLSHLSVSLVDEAVLRNIPIVFTLHDYWLICPKGQFIQKYPENQNDLWAVCNRQEDRKCAMRCYACYFGGNIQEREKDIQQWTDWVARRMRTLRHVMDVTDMFIAPSQYLLQRFLPYIPESKICFLDYGFDLKRFPPRQRNAGREPFIFAYIGTHIPAKGIDLLIRAFSKVQGNCLLRIFGRDRGQDTKALKSLATSLPKEIAQRIEWKPEYQNENIVQDVFNHIDVIVVPSIWVENSPLVIHEAQQCRIPVITANVGGMAEYVHHEVNGLLFEHRNEQSLAEQMQRLLDYPNWAIQLGQRGYLFSPDKNIPSIQEHVRQVEQIYSKVLENKQNMSTSSQCGPWRITFDTNPDICNLHCIMCEDHSQYKNKQDQHQTRGIMNPDLIKKVVQEAVGLGLREIIPSTMGEPLLYPCFDIFLDLCREYHLKLNLTTNGTFPIRPAGEWAKLIAPVASDVKISWNGACQATQENIMQGSNFSQMLAKTKDFIAVRNEVAKSNGSACSMTMQVTFMTLNVEEIPDLIQLAIQLGFDRVKGHHLWTHFPEIQKFSMRENPNKIAQWNRAVTQAQAVADRYLLPNGKHIRLENIYPLTDENIHNLAPSGKCLFLGREMWVDTQGYFHPCCAPDKERRTLGYCFNLQEVSVQDIWNSASYRMLCNSYYNYSLCIRCNMRQQQAMNIERKTDSLDIAWKENKYVSLS